MTRRIVGILLGALLCVRPALAQDTASSTTSPLTIFPHADTDRWWLSGQLNLIEQAHGGFRSPYEGANSLRAARERALSRVWTIFTGLRVAPGTEILVDIESAGGRGLSDALGLAGFTNLDVVRNPDLGSAPYLGRLEVHYTHGFGGGTVSQARGPWSLASVVPARRLEIRAGKFSLPDFLDVNAAGSDSHLQFMNWTVDNNGAYDYAADTRGYTYGAIAEYDSPRWSLRWAEVLMPTVANGITLDWDLSRARAENLELELHPTARLTTRWLAFQNHANMGSYDDAIQGYRSGADQQPDIEAHRRQGRVKSGFGANLEYAATTDVRVFARAGGNEGRNESFAYTEVNNSAQAGADVAGARWSRPHDRIGAALVSNGLSTPHREYLGLGGLGFLLGDGSLRYGREDIIETYYNAHVRSGAFVSGDVQYVIDPGYNRDRGPVLVSAVRLHVDF